MFFIEQNFYTRKGTGVIYVKFRSKNWRNVYDVSNAKVETRLLKLNDADRIPLNSWKLYTGKRYKFLTSNVRMINVYSRNVNTMEYVAVDEKLSLFIFL